MKNSKFRTRKFRRFYAVCLIFLGVGVMSGNFFGSRDASFGTGVVLYIISLIVFIKAIKTPK